MFWAILLAPEVIISHLFSKSVASLVLNWFVSAASLHCRGCKGGRSKYSSCLGSLKFPTTILGCSAGEYILYNSCAWKHFNQDWKSWCSLDLLDGNFKLSSSLPAQSPFCLPSALWLPFKSILFDADKQHKMDWMEVQKVMLLLTSQRSTLLPSIQQNDWVMLKSNYVSKSPLHQFKYMLKCCGTAD